jgi:sugar/nucleoside kinase (ribokinase family)
MPSFVVAGHICLDLIPKLHGSTDFQPGRLYESGPITMGTGGAVSNVGRALHQLGAEVSLVGKIGSDLLGQAVRSLLGNLADSLTISGSDATSYSVVLSPPGRDRTFLHHPGCNDTFIASDIPRDLLAPGSFFHFGYPPLMRSMYEGEGAELEAVFKLAKMCECHTSLDLSFPDPTTESGAAPWRKILGRTLPYVDLFTPSIDELRLMLEDESATPEQLADWSMAHGTRSVLIKLGEQGLYYQDAENQRFQPCKQVEVAGTAGSGDATIAGFLYALANQYTVPEACEIAVAVGAFACEQPDTTSGIPHFDVVKNRLESSTWTDLELNQKP